MDKPNTYTYTLINHDSKVGRPCLPYSYVAVGGCGQCGCDFLSWKYLWVGKYAFWHQQETNLTLYCGVLCYYPLTIHSGSILSDWCNHTCQYHPEYLRVSGGLHGEPGEGRVLLRFDSREVLLDPWRVCPRHGVLPGTTRGKLVGGRPSTATVTELARTQWSGYRWPAWLHRPISMRKPYPS